jgi:hypothetical protein
VGRWPISKNAGGRERFACRVLGGGNGTEFGGDGPSPGAVRRVVEDPFREECRGSRAPSGGRLGIGRELDAHARRLGGGQQALLATHHSNDEEGDHARQGVDEAQEQIDGHSHAVRFALSERIGATGSAEEPDGDIREQNGHGSDYNRCA